MKQLIYTFFSLILFTSISFNSVTASNDVKQNTSVLQSKQIDVTGNEQGEQIKLKGILFGGDSGYFHNLWIDIHGLRSKEWKIMYKGGYNPRVQFLDLNHDHVKDIFYQVTPKPSNEIHHYQLHTLKNGTLKKIPLPMPNTLTGKFTKNFTVHIHLNPNQRPIKMDVSQQRNKYIAAGIYKKNGKLAKGKNLMISPITNLRPIFISKAKGYGLKGYQTVNGLTDNDHLGTITSLWYFNHNKWIKLQTKWHKATSQ